MRMNLPNQITVARFFIAIAFIVLMTLFDCRQVQQQIWMLDLAFWLFLIAAVTDILDGYLARKQNQVTSFGRILDPFVDKILVGGAFVLFLGRGFVDETGRNVTGLAAWMVVVIISRELLVSGLRGFAESGGKPYAANIWGKTKMVIQVIAVAFILQTIGNWRNVDWVITLRPAVIWITVGVTAFSVISYLVASRDALAEQSRG
jgi:CDP-diacylglycerol--glycerol-3-phosphate 3-phosphatidyltransferase